MVALDPTLTEAAVRDLARPQSYDRGENYYDEGAVVEISRRGETLRAAVEGSQYEPYEVRIDLDDGTLVVVVLPPVVRLWACQIPNGRLGECRVEGNHRSVV